MLHDVSNQPSLSDDHFALIATSIVTHLAIASIVRFLRKYCLSLAPSKKNTADTFGSQASIPDPQQHSTQTGDTSVHTQKILRTQRGALQRAYSTRST